MQSCCSSDLTRLISEIDDVVSEPEYFVPYLKKAGPQGPLRFGKRRDGPTGPLRFGKRSSLDYSPLAAQQPHYFFV
ncbi:hypothetical protein Y032_0038g3614 [Ancylostoma ceylanicum]|uniref:Uncharacterized protein n=1 Tax=Ancylostoma ceylanicum TaxID=53326 RepID=A0A016UJL0_9BILA|nr:hypothetical protein Y032_0038g3614 [Ancylostoma ceylanicum]